MRREQIFGVAFAVRSILHVLYVCFLSYSKFFKPVNWLGQRSEILSVLQPIKKFVIRQKMDVILALKWRRFRPDGKPLVDFLLYENDNHRKMMKRCLFFKLSF